MRTDMVMPLPASSSPSISYEAKTLWSHMSPLALLERPNLDAARTVEPTQLQPPDAQC